MTTNLYKEGVFIGAALTTLCAICSLWLTTGFENYLQDYGYMLSYISWFPMMMTVVCAVTLINRKMNA